MNSESAAKKDTQKLQRAIIDGLEDVKAQDIQVFDTEHLSPLFERVIVASGTSNRQTKALAASVRDAVREAGFAKPRTEGEDNGEWIIVDCGAAVAHIMQPAIRQYYHLEDIWGEKPVRMKLGAPKPVMPAPKVAEPKESRKGKATGAAKPAGRAPAAKKVAAKKTAAKESAASGSGVASRKRAPVKASAGPVQKVIGKPVAGKKAPARKTTAARKTPAARKAPSRKTAASGR
jgi:ribosome-associated protein